MDFNNLKFLVVGAGFFGSVIAERIANDLEEHVVIIEKRDHIGGNCSSKKDDSTGIEYHQYGTHIFHTSEKTVWKYINNFTSFNGYRHQVLTIYRNKVYQMPINLETINSFYNVNLRPYEVDDFLKRDISKEKIGNPQNLEEKAVSLVGHPLYEAFIKGYTLKHWQKDPKTLPASIIERIPVRKNYDENYYFDTWQGIPIGGYDEIFQKMLDHPKIELHLKVDFFDMREQIPNTCFIIYTGPIDRLFNYKFGMLEWRGLSFEKETVCVEDFQGTSVMNYAEENIPYTRIHEPRHLHPERDYTKEKTLIIKEYPKASTSQEAPYYSINNLDNNKKCEKYFGEKKKLRNIILGGRLTDYKYYDMDQTISMALKSYEERIKGNMAKTKDA